MSNQLIIDELLITAEYYDGIGDNGRCNAYKRAIKSIKQYGHPITSGEHAKELKWIGDGIGGKIDGILGTSSKSKKSQRITRTDYDNSPKKVSITLIDNIRNKAKKRKEDTSIEAIDNIRYDSSHNSNNSKRSHKNTTKTQQKHNNSKDSKDSKGSKGSRTSRTLRIKQYEYAPKPEADASVVRRNDIDQLLKCIKRVWYKLAEKQSTKGVRYTPKMECCGGFRRGDVWCHECVIILSTDMASQRQRYIFEELIRVLYKLRLIESKKLTDTDYYQGILDISRLFKSARTGDYPVKRTNVPLVLRLVDEGAWPSALLRWTGPKNYWIKLQSAAQKQNFELLENGLYSKTRGGIGKRLFHRDEYDILTDLGLGYLEPIYRR